MERIEIETSELSPGMVLARSIRDKNGKLLVGVNKKVTSSMIERLAKYQISSVVIYTKGNEEEVIKIALKKAPVLLVEPNERKNLKIIKPQRETKKHDDISVYNTFFSQFCSLLDRSAHELFRQGVDIELIKEPVILAVKNKTVINLLMDLRVKAQYLLNHCAEVAILCAVVGLEKEMNEIRLRNLILSALLHDVGMIQIQNNIMFKVEPLLPEEIEVLKTHSAKSVLMLKDYGKLDTEVLEIIYQHHERVNGTGYPKGLTENIINHSAKILSACDVYSAISHERAYRGKFHPQEKIEFLFPSGNYYFDYDIVKVLLEKISIYHRGQWVKLNTGHVGVISGVDYNFPTRPYIKLVFDEKGRLLAEEKEVFLGDRGLVRVFIEQII